LSKDNHKNVSIFSLWKQLPDLQIEETKQDNGDHDRDEYQYDNVGPYGYPRVIPYGREEDEKHDRAVYFGWKEGDAPLNGRFKSMMDESTVYPTNRGTNTNGFNVLLVKDGSRIRKN
jgi:hypothetical protein